MQLYALDGTEGPILATNAERQKSYRCPECAGVLRVRGGSHRQAHFYHLRVPPNCSQHKKGLPHIYTQLLAHQLLPPGECILEKSFPEIGRIADVAWEKKKIIFEIQCSPISLTEVQERCRDYESLGFRVIWVLHEKRFNKRKRGSVEAFLRNCPCYFTNMNEAGKGIIYDCFEICRGARRVYQGMPLKVDIASPVDLPASSITEDFPQAIRQRRALYFEGDLVDRILKSPEESIFLQQLKEQERRLTLFSRPTFSLLSFLKRGYQTLFQILLEAVGA